MDLRKFSNPGPRGRPKLGILAGPKGPPKRSQNWTKIAPKWSQIWAQKVGQNGAPFWGQKAPKPFEFLVFSLKTAPRRGAIFGPKSGPKWGPKWAQNGPNFGPKRGPKRPKNAPKSIKIVVFLALAEEGVRKSSKIF